MSYNFVADGSHTKKLFSRLFSEKCNFGGSRAAYDVHLRLIGKLVIMDLLFVLIELFARCYGWNATSDYWLEIGVFEGNGSVSAKFLRRRGLPPLTSFARIDRPYNFSADGSHTKKLCILSSREVHCYTENVSEPPPPLERLRSNVRCWS